MKSDYIFCRIRCKFTSVVKLAWNKRLFHVFLFVVWKRQRLVWPKVCKEPKIYISVHIPVPFGGKGIATNNDVY